METRRATSEEQTVAFGRRRTYDRTRLLREADRARARRRWRRAIALYRRVLIAEPGNVELRLRIGPLLARTGQTFDAWQSFDHAGRACLRAGQGDRALAVYREATRWLPRHYTAWRAVADLERRLKRPERAREALLQGRRKMRGRRQRPEAIALLRAARQLDPDDVATALDLARELARARQRPEALALLAHVAGTAEGRGLRRVRARLFRLDPSGRHAWAFARAAWRARHDRRVRVSPRARLAAERA